MIFSTVSHPSNKAIKQVYQLLNHTRQLLLNISLWSTHSFWTNSNEHVGSQLKTELTSFQSLSYETILWSPPWLLQFLMYLMTEEYLSLKMATCMLGKHFVFVFLAPLKEGLHGTMPPNMTQMKASSMTSLPWQADFRTTPGLMLCSIICTRSALASEGGHQISVNLFLRAGDSCKRKKKKKHSLTFQACKSCLIYTQLH